MNYIAYLRVSTTKQDYGLEAQQDMINKWLKGKGELIATFQEKISGKINKRPELERAIALCKKEDATLLIAKLDRLSRDVAFLFELKNSGIQIACCELPELNTLTLGIFATMAQHEREIISARTKAGLEVARSKGKQIGRKKGDLIKPPIQAREARRSLAIDRNKSAIQAAKHFKEKGLNNSEIAREMNSLGFTAPKGGSLESGQIRRLLAFD
jgi:DNA invertase Pin-like site-specific DNA recombinase